ncbi:transposase [Polaribacter sp. Q13]|uniref:transposase n=1 Tax=Polaribacter sp. Q13 TaxID=2806551 RepID=UPI002078EBB2|nr:transposase [Polaribacter sp. Q13]
MFFSKNIGNYLSIDETAFSNGDLYSIITNKNANGKKGTLLAMIKDTKGEDIIRILQKWLYIIRIYSTIFDHRSTNTSAESFIAKIKAFRAQFRGVRNIKFFLFRLSNIYA